MTNEISNQTPVLALQDTEGHLYLLTMDQLQQGRVPDEQAEAMIQAFNDGAEVNGYFWGDIFKGVSSAANKTANVTNGWVNQLQNHTQQLHQTSQKITHS